MSQSVKVLGTGCYTPEYILTNEELSQMVVTSDEWIQQRTGIKTRHISTENTTWEMAVKAAKQAIEMSGVETTKIRAVIATTVTQDYYYPSLSCIVSQQLGLENPLTIDVNSACTGFIYALDLARRYLMDEDIEYVLLVSSEMLSKQVDYEDRSTCILFGDGAGALLLTKGTGLFGSFLASEKNKMESLFARACPAHNPWTGDIQSDKLFPDNNSRFLAMDGREIYRFASRTVPEAILKCCSKMKIQKEQIDFIIPHQANLRIIESIAKRLDIDMAHFPHNVENYGNTSSASIPMCFHENMQNNLLQKGNVVAFCGFGAGLTYGACIMEIL